ncbi:MAG TPA: Tim44-like domain-containing protein [Macromonas sp.]|nr:Tim44-like domain-containing protein [Macromonas sp.]
MKQLSLLAVVLTLGLSLSTVDAEAAKRFGGGKTSGMQRQTTQVDKSTSTASPAGTNATAAPAAAKTAAAAPAAAAPKRSWMGPIAGLAAGLGLAALASHLGFGEELASFMMMALLAMAALMAITWFMRKRAQPKAASGQMRYAGMAPQAFEPAAPSYQAPAGGGSGGSMIGANLGAQPSMPADFDSAGFERTAKANFLRMQAANDAADLNDIRQFTSPEMFAEIQLQFGERGAARQQTRILNLDARVLEVAQENGQHVASVRFTGQAQEDAGQPAEAFDEIWHLTKPVQGSSGWVIAGIQQTV